MNKNDKIKLLDRCIKLYDKALEIRMSNYSMFVVYLSQARALKSLIEDTFDCQPTDYYEKYQMIVELEKKIGGIKFGFTTNYN